MLSKFPTSLPVSNPSYSSRALLVAISFSLIASCFITEPAQANNLPRNGPYVRAGVGYSPYVEVEETLLDLREKSSGLALSGVGGIVWGRYHSVEFRWSSIFLQDYYSRRQGVAGVTYTHYFKMRGPLLFTSLGYGLQHGPAVGVDPRRVESDDGGALLFGAGLRFNPKLEGAVEYSFGATNRYIDENDYFDFRHRQLVFVVRYGLFGG